MDDFEERQRERERRRREREEERKREEEEFERERAKRNAEIEERRKRREEERLAAEATTTRQPTNSVVTSKPVQSSSTPLTTTDASLPEIDDAMLAEIEAQVLAEMEAELEIQAAAELELEADKLLAELALEEKKTNSVRATIPPKSPGYTPPLRSPPVASTRPVNYSSGGSGSGVCEESLVNKKADRKAWLESLMKNEQQEKRKTEIQERHREINRDFAKKETESVRQRLGSPNPQHQSQVDTLDLGLDDDDAWADALLKVCSRDFLAD